MPIPAVLAAALLPCLSPQGLELSTGLVPGSTEARITGAPAGGLVAFLLGTREGTVPLPGGACLGIAPEVTAGITFASAEGHAFATARFPVGAAAGLGFVAQALALDPQAAFGSPGACSTSPVQHLRVPELGATADLYVLFGQSNAEGYAESRTLPASLRGPLPQGRVWNELAGAWQPICAGINNTTLQRPDRCGPELTLIRELTATGRTVFLVKFAVGQTSLGPTPGPWNEWGPAAGELYGELLRRLDRASATLRSDGLRPQVRGVCMMQGESDALDPALAGGYGERLTALVQQFRRDLAERELAGTEPAPFLVGIVNAELTQTGFQHVPAVRAAQQSVTEDQPWCAAVETTGMALQTDRVHFDTEGVLALGSAFATALRLQDRR